MKRPAEIFFLFLLIPIISLRAIYSGGGLIPDPNGRMPEMVQHWLKMLALLYILLQGITHFILLRISDRLAFSGLNFSRNQRILKSVYIFCNKYRLMLNYDL